MNAKERQIAILCVLCERRYETAENLAAAFGVSERTIRRDINALMCDKPVRTVQGRYGGGVYLEEWFRPSQTHLAPKQMTWLRNLIPTLSAEDQKIANSILIQFSPKGTL